MIGTIDQAAMQLRTVALAAYTQELTYSDADGVDLTLAIEDEIIDCQWSRHPRCERPDRYPRPQLIRWLFGTNTRDHIRRANSLGR
jgi:hypothetical protein